MKHFKLCIKACCSKIKAFIFASACFFSALLLSGCDGVSQNALGSGSSDEKTPVKVTFNLLTTAQSSGSRVSRATSGPLPNELIYYDVTDSSATLRRKALHVGANEVDLLKNSMNAVGFVYNPNLASLETDSKSIHKDISSGIQIIGSLKILSAGLDSLPINGSASDEIQLGTLATETNSISSDVNAATFLASTGYTETDISSYSFYDNGLRKLLNPDVDGNGIYDVDENRLWQITIHRPGNHLYKDDFLGSIPQIPLSSLILSGFNILFWLNGAFPGSSTVFLEFPPGTVYKDRDGNVITGLSTPRSSGGEGPGGQFSQSYFNISSLVSTPSPPYSGDYTLKINDKSYSFKNLEFLTPTNGSPEGFIFPETRITYDTNDYVQKIYYSWWVVRNGAIVRPTENEVRLSVEQFYYYFPKISVKMPEDFNQVYYRSGVIDLSSYRITKSELGKVEGQTDSLRSVYWDRMGNEWTFTYHFNENRPLD